MITWRPNFDNLGFNSGYLRSLLYSLVNDSPLKVAITSIPTTCRHCQENRTSSGLFGCLA